MLIGLCGKPSSGKSTFFQAATGIPVERADYPFTTIKPNHGIGYVKMECVEKELGVKCNPRNGFCINSDRFVSIELLDVAGLVPGAHEGKGLGNQFLDDLRKADVLIHILDSSGSTNEKGEKVGEGSHDPAYDITFLEEELIHWIKGILENNWSKLLREQNSKKIEEILYEQFAGLGITQESIDKTLKTLQLNGQRFEEWTEDEKYSFCKSMREIGKPVIIAANKADLSVSKKNMENLKKKFPNYVIVPCSSEAELTLREASKKGFIEYIPGDKKFKKTKELSPQQEKALEFIQRTMDSYEYGTGIQKILNLAVFEFLKYIAVFPVATSKLTDTKGNILPDCFLMPPNSNAKDLASKIHSDMADKFIKAIDLRTKRPYGADYVLKHRDVLEIVFRK